jgi:UDP-N-acetylglucosamine 2-epimerase (non-hydrolysing)
LFAPTERAKKNLLNEGIHEGKVFVTGNTIVDAVMQNIELAKDNDPPQEAQVDEGYFLATLHRQENVDIKERLRKIIKGLELVANEFRVPIIYPIHPRTRKRIIQFNIHVNNSIKLVDPVDYIAFLKLMSNAKIVFTDSGGVQEEACILRVPCVTLRYSTERPETLAVGSNVLAGAGPKNILEKARIMFSRTRDWENPYGDEKAGRRIVNIINDEKFSR